MSQTPIAIFLYKRPNHARQLLDSLQRCSRLNECNIYIYCDGVNKPADFVGVQETRSVAREFASKYNVVIQEREQNMGLARSIVGGVTQLCAEYGRVIVLEEDFILHPFFIDFMLQSLDHYANEEDVAQVTGFSFPINKSPNPDAFFLPIVSIWGWATWQRAWNLFSWDALPALETLGADHQLQYRFDLDASYPYTDMMRLVAEGRIDAWAILWYWQTFSANKLTLYPRQSLVWQNGFDAVAVNTKGTWLGMQEPLDSFKQVAWSHSIVFPEAIKTNPVTFENLKEFLRHRPQNTATNHFRFRGVLKRVFSWKVKY